MKPTTHTVLAEFHTPTDDVDTPTMSLGIDWLDRAAVRDFAALASDWLAKGNGYRVTTRTHSIVTKPATMEELANRYREIRHERREALFGPSKSVHRSESTLP